MKLIYHRQQWPDQDSTYIMTEDGSGMVRVTYEKTTSELKEALISDLFVYEDRRHEGIGTELLLAAVKEFADKVDYAYLTIKSDYRSVEKNPKLKNLVDFYESRGFKVSGIYSEVFCMVKDVDKYKSNVNDK